MTIPLLRVHNLAEGVCQCLSPKSRRPCDSYAPVLGSREELHCMDCKHGLACHVAKALMNKREAGNYERL